MKRLSPRCKTAIRQRYINKGQILYFSDAKTFLFWIKKAVLHFPTFYHKGWMTDNTRMYICITWADSRRRDIYEKFLEKDGFSFMNIDGKKTLVKEISINE